MNTTSLLAIVIITTTCLTILPQPTQALNQHTEPMLGIDANYANAMQTFPFTWRYHHHPIDLYPFFHTQGINAFRLRVFVKDNGTDSLTYALTTAHQVQNLHMNLSVILFFSSDWSDIGKQPSPTSWDTLYHYGNLTLEQKANVIRGYTHNVTTAFLNQGIDPDLYEIGNEIDYGIAGMFETNTTRRENITLMQNTTWKQMAPLITAAIEGVRTADPTSHFTLHIAHWWDVNFSTAFFTTMINEGVPFDNIGLSFYPSSGIYNITLTYQGIGNGTRSQELFRQTVVSLNQSLGKPIIICEYAYPSTGLILGPFASFNYAVQGFPLTKQGQKAWLYDFLSWANNHSCIKGTFYFSPEFHRLIWGPFSLFTYFGNAKPAIDVFKEI